MSVAFTIEKKEKNTEGKKRLTLRQRERDRKRRKEIKRQTY